MRRTIAIPNEWVERADTGGYAQVPKEHLWVECENYEKRQDDSLTEFGHITSKMVIGEVTSVLWPIRKSMSEIDRDQEINLFVNKVKDSPKLEKGAELDDIAFTKHSRVMSNDDIFRKYGRPKYH